MKKETTRWLSWILVFVLFVGICPISAQAAGKLSASDIQAKIDNYYNDVYQSGSKRVYWNAGHSTKTLKENADAGQYAKDVTEKTCTTKYIISNGQSKWSHSKKCSPNTCQSNIFDGAYQCHGFARYMCYVIFGSYPRATYSLGNVNDTLRGTADGWRTYKKGDTFPGIQVGDMIRRSGHSVVVYSVSSNGKVSIIDCNYRSEGASDACDIRKRNWKYDVNSLKESFNDGKLYICRYSKAEVTDAVIEDIQLTPTVTFSNYQVRKLTETSAEPYATATATNGLVKKVGMYIGTSKDKLQLLGSDNGKAGTKKNMWYNTTKYEYPLQPGTTYYYQPFAEVDGKAYWGDIQYFTTPGTKPTQKEEPPKACSHDYNSVGRCSKCGQEYPMSVSSMSATTYEAVKNDVPVRNRPYAPEEIIKSLSKGSKVSVIASGKNSLGNLWYKLDDGTWVYSENLKKAATSSDTQPAKPEPAAPANTYTALVTCNADILNVRKGPGTSYDKVGGLERGSKCTVYPNKASNGWLWVEGSGVSGYAASNKLTTYTGNTRDGLVTCKADLLNVRKGPGTSYDKVGQIPRGATCTVYLDVKADWYFVSYGGFAGYASKNMITLR